MEDLVEPIFVPRSEFWKGKKVLVTGHTGFKGSWLSIWLSRLGAKVIGISLPQEEKPNLFTTLMADRTADSRRGTPEAAYDPQKKTFLEGS